MNVRMIGKVAVSAIGLGAMPMSLEGRPDEQRCIRTVHAALDAGVTLIDTADAYCVNADDVGHNERLIAKALATYGGDTSSVLVATKGGHTRTADGDWEVNGAPEHIRAACEASLTALGVEAIGLYQYHRPDPTVPYATTLEVFADLQREGKVQMVGISNATVDQIREARDIVELVSVQNQFSPDYRSSEDELRFCGEHGIAFLPWSPLGGIGSAGDLGGRFAPFAEVARELGVSPQQVCLAWMLAKGDHVVPIPGSSRPETIRDSAGAVGLTLTPEQQVRLDAA